GGFAGADHDLRICDVPQSLEALSDGGPGLSPFYRGEHSSHHLRDHRGRGLWSASRGHDRAETGIRDFCCSLCHCLGIGALVERRSAAGRAGGRPAARLGGGPCHQRGVRGTDDMNKQSRRVLAGAVSLKSPAPVYLATLKGRQALGRPAVKVVNEPLYGDATIQSYGDARNGTKTNVLFVAATNTIYLPRRVLDYESV